MSPFFWVASAVLFLSIHGQNASIAQEPALRILFYNVENLFDTINDPLTNDDEFTPGGTKLFGSARYEKKLFNISNVLAYSFDNAMPDIIGLAEVENANVLQDLIKAAPLRAKEYRVLHYDSPDKRGIDVGLLYDPEKFKIMASRPVRVKLGTDNWPTRDILHISGIVEGEMFHFFINHWPSRVGGEDATSVKRVAAAKTLLHEIQRIEEGKNIVVMGDLNDGPQSESVELLTDCSNPDAPCFVNTVEHLERKSTGTYFYGDEWEVLDHIIVSPDLTEKSNKFFVGGESGKVIRHPWMMYNKDNGQEIPDRTYAENYFGGYSDHLPVSLIVYKTK